MREYFIVAYAEHLMSDPSMWAIAVSYLRFCGPQARELAKKYLLHLNFDIPIPGSREVVPPSTKEEPRLATLNAILVKCAELGFRDAQVEICRVRLPLPNEHIHLINIQGCCQKIHRITAIRKSRPILCTK
jgi:hypothetical protein